MARLVLRRRGRHRARRSTLRISLRRLAFLAILLAGGILGADAA